MRKKWTEENKVEEIKRNRSTFFFIESERRERERGVE